MNGPAEELGRIMGRSMAEPRTPRKKIYLAGGISDWRGRVREFFEGKALCMDPFTESRQNSITSFVGDDLHHVTGCDIVLFYHDYHVFDGAAVECGFAYALDKQIVYVCKQSRVSSFIAGISKAVFTELEPALEYIEKRLL